MIRSKSTVLFWLILAVACALRPAGAQSGSTDNAEATATRPASPTTTSEVKLSRAERILRLEQAIEETRQELSVLEKLLDDPEGEFAKAKEDFARIDKRLKERERELATQPSDDPNRLDGLRKARELAEERFELAIKDREGSQQKCELLKRKLQQDSEALERLRNPDEATSRPAAAADLQPVPPQPAGQPAAQPSQQASDQTGESGPPAPKPTPPVATVQMPATPSTAPPPATAQETAPSTPQTAPKQTSPAETSPELEKKLAEARREAEEQAERARRAEVELQSVAERIATLRENIQAEQELLENARQRSRNAGEAYSHAREYVQKLISTGAPAEETQRFWAQVDEAEKRAAEAEAAVAHHQEQVDELQTELMELQSEHIQALETAKQTQRDVQQAQDKLRKLQNPYSLVKILQWLIDHGPPILGILLGMVALIYLIKITEHRLVRLISMRGSAETIAERESRAKTLASVFRNVGSTAVLVAGVLMVLTEVGINIIPLLGAAGVVGLAIAFGAQSLIKDYFSGFIILLENQYTIGDVVKIGDLAGVVEHISLRMTVLRDLEGNAHFMPHGEIKSVTNMTHSWSRALFEIRVAYREQVDRVIQVLMELARELRRDPAFAPLILDDAEMLGVDSFGDSSVNIKFFIKTRPLRQWTVKREMLRRIKNRFDELGIEIPFPHRTVYHRYEEGQQPPDGDVLAPLPGRKAD